MTAKESATVPDMSWEKELAPKVTRGSLMLPIVIYAIWTGFLAYIAIDRWFGELQ